MHTNAINVSLTDNLFMLCTSVTSDLHMRNYNHLFKNTQEHELVVRKTRAAVTPEIAKSLHGEVTA